MQVFHVQNIGVHRLIMLLENTEIVYISTKYVNCMQGNNVKLNYA